jgi:hypothetical protein
MPRQLVQIARRRNSAGVGAAGSAKAGAAPRRPSRPSPAVSRSSAPAWVVVRISRANSSVIGCIVARGVQAHNRARGRQASVARTAGEICMRQR